MDNPQTCARQDDNTDRRTALHKRAALMRHFVLNFSRHCSCWRHTVWTHNETNFDQCIRHNADVLETSTSSRHCKMSRAKIFKCQAESVTSNSSVLWQEQLHTIKASPQRLVHDSRATEIVNTVSWLQCHDCMYVEFTWSRVDCWTAKNHTESVVKREVIWLIILQVSSYTIANSRRLRKQLREVL